MKVMEDKWVKKVADVRGKELKLFGKYVNVKSTMTAVYGNAGVLISTLIFLFADKSRL